MDPRFTRTAKLIGTEGVNLLASAHVAVFGLGGVGSYAVEALARAGVGTLSLFDYDTVDISNINRQIPALTETVGRMKTEVVRERIHQIHPDAVVHICSDRVDGENLPGILAGGFDFVIDAIDMVTSKIELICRCQALGIPIIASMGTGNKLNPGALRVEDLYKTHTCPLAKVMRNELKKRGVLKQPVVFSTEVPRKPLRFDWEPSSESRRETPASISFVPPVSGLLMAGYAVNHLLEKAGLPDR